jgi:hypothetical protein
MKSFKKFLNENNIERLHTQHKNIISTVHDEQMLKYLKKQPGYSVETHNKHIINHLSTFDNTSDKKNTAWLVDQYKNKKIRYEDLNQVRSTLDLFNKHGKDLPSMPNEQNLNSPISGTKLKNYSSPGHLQGVLNTHLGVDTSIKDEDYHHPDAEKVYDNNGYKSWHVQSEDAAKAIKKFDPACRWCTADDKNSMFSSYSRGLHILRTPDGKYYQHHADSGQFMDNLDDSIDKEKFKNEHPETLKMPELKYFKEFNTSEDYKESEAGRGHVGTLNIRAYETTDPVIHQQILNHPKVDAHSFYNIAYETTDSAIHQQILNHPKVDSVALGDVAINTKDPAIHQQILNHPKVDSVALRAVAINTKDPAIHQQILNHPKYKGKI